ncbi:hypothetical protein NDA14_007637 [Ustilago hordei]|nr:hypothetical protein NDA14_007637 [Ustilago hordei]
MRPKERSVGPTDDRTEEAEHGIWALHPANFGDHKGGPKPEGIGLGCWEEEYGILGTININVMMTPRSGVSVDDDEVDGVGDEIGDVDDNEVDGVGDKVGGVDDNEVDGVGDKVGGVNTSVQCVDLMLEMIPGPQWTTAFGSIYIRTANLLWAPSDVR